MFEHLILECPCFRGARERVPMDVAEMVEQAGGTSNTLQAVIHQTLGLYRGAVPTIRATSNHWYIGTDSSTTATGTKGMKTKHKTKWPEHIGRGNSGGNDICTATMERRTHKSMVQNV
jgi:hypothetical protein